MAGRAATTSAIRAQTSAKAIDGGVDERWDERDDTGMSVKGSVLSRRHRLPANEGERPAGMLG
jgi:hypothetical protein